MMESGSAKCPKCGQAAIVIWDDDDGTLHLICDTCLYALYGTISPEDRKTVRVTHEAKP